MKIDVGRDRWVPVPERGIVLRVRMAPARSAVPGTPGQRQHAGRLLAAYRQRARLTQAELADRLSDHRPTLTRNDISRWERAARLPGDYWLDLLCRQLRLSEDAAASIAAVRDLGCRLRPRLLVYRPGRTASRTLDLPFGGWTAVPDCRWRARPISATRARLLPTIDSQR